MYVYRVQAVFLAVALFSLTAVAAPRLADVAYWQEAPAGDPVIDRGPEGTWDHYAVDNPYLFAEGGKLYCFYEAQDKPLDQGGHERVGLAFSDDGIAWVKHRGNPVLDVGGGDAFDSLVAKLPVVLRHGDTYYLYYSGRKGMAKSIGLATSKDLMHWTKHPGNPVIEGRADAWDRVLSTYPAPPFERGGRYYMLYRGMAGLYHDQGAGLAVSDDLVHWQRAQDGPVIPVKHEIASFAVVKDGPAYAGIAQAPVRQYWTSEDLHTWQEGPRPGFTAEAVDTLSNPVLFKGVWTIVYEKRDRIHRATGQERAPAGETAE